MFSSTSSTIHLFQSLSSSPFNPPYISDHETTDIFHQHHHHIDPLTIPSVSTNPLPVTETVMNMAASNNSMMSEQDVTALGGELYNRSHHFLSGKKSVKKDRHSKIYTAQGLRDRRVRLSIEIARKFFDLQEMLGFDKASKTLDWLLTKSKNAIEELAKNGGEKCLSSTSTNCEVVSESGDLEDRVPSGGQRQRMKKMQNMAVDLLAKESRAKARARARERTRVKMCTRKLHETKQCPDFSCLKQPSPLNQDQSWKKSSSYNGTSSMNVVARGQVDDPSSHHSLANHSPKGNIIEESIVMRRKLRPSATMGYQQNLLMLKDASCNRNSNFLPNLAQNWDISSAIAHSSFRPFTTMNPSTEIQPNGKLWGTGNN